jgi:glucosylceramidase
MKKNFISILLVCCIFFVAAQPKKVEWVSTTQNNHWTVLKDITTSATITQSDVEIDPSTPLQVIEGFGGCFNELGWASLSLLSNNDREAIFKELFAPGFGASFTICRMPVGANDFSLKWYSYDETDGDFDLSHFSITNDMYTLVPFIKNAKKYNPHLQLWASPWSPPQWMKQNKRYAAATVPSKAQLKEYADKGYKMDGFDFSNVENNVTADQVGHEGSNLFIRDPRYFKSYALYFSKFIDAYQKLGINIGMVMPQNEFNSAQPFPSCPWTAAGLSRFLTYLGPAMQKKGIKVFFGTVERGNEKLVDTILTAPGCEQYISGVGFQWAGKGAIAGIHKRYPRLTLYQSEQECGNGKNDWSYCKYTWTLMKHYFNSGANAYMYWNISLPKGGLSHWGWKQNSLVTVDTTTKQFSFNHEYYLFKHLSHYVRPGSRLLSVKGAFKDLLAFKNKDNSIVVVVENEAGTDRTLHIKTGNQMIEAKLAADSFNTFLIK